MFYDGSEARLDSNFLQNFSNRQLCNPARRAIGIQQLKAPLGSPMWPYLGGSCGVAGAEDAALSGASGDSDMRLQASLVTPSAGRGKSAACDEERVAP